MRMKQTMGSRLDAILLSMTTAAVASEHDHSLRVGKKGEVYNHTAYRGWRESLQPGTYVVQHRISGDSHFVRFTELKQVENSKGEARFAYT